MGDHAIFLERMRAEKAKDALNTIEMAMIGIHFNQDEGINLLKIVQAHIWPPVEIEVKRG